MVKSSAQILDSAMNLPVALQRNTEANFSDFSAREESKDISIVEKISEKLDVKVRFNRLKKRMRNRSTNIL